MLVHKMCMPIPYIGGINYGCISISYITKFEIRL